jgi:hypothetical protein
MEKATELVGKKSISPLRLKPELGDGEGDSRVSAES